MSTIPKSLKLKDYITLVGTTLGLIAIIFAGIGRRDAISFGFFLITLSLGTDLIDGYIARKTGTVNEMGKQLDSLSDSLTFGIAPAILTFQGFKRGTPYDIILLIACILFAMGAMLRLARFNIQEAKGYSGVPSPASALMMIVFFYANYFYSFALGGINYPFLEIAYYTIPFFLVFISWLNITTHISFGEKGKTTYIVIILFAPTCPVFGIIGILNPNFVISIVAAIFFTSSFFGLLIYVIYRLFHRFYKTKKKTT
ncbi:MAG: CDP-alcohol phosphatidyltransferase family protein [Promethearchaeota archaeon]